MLKTDKLVRRWKVAVANGCPQEALDTISDLGALRLVHDELQHARVPKMMMIVGTRLATDLRVVEALRELKEQWRASFKLADVMRNLVGSLLDHCVLEFEDIVTIAEGFSRYGATCTDDLDSAPVEMVQGVPLELRTRATELIEHITKAGNERAAWQ